MPFPALDEVNAKLKDVHDRIGKIFAEAGTSMDFTLVKSIPQTVLDGDRPGLTKRVQEHVVALNTEAEALGKERERLQPLEAAYKAAQERRALQEGREPPGEPGDGKREKGWGGDGASLGQLFIASAAYKGRVSGGAGAKATLDVEPKRLKTLMTTSTGWVPESTRSGRVVEYAYAGPDVIAIIPANTTDQVAYKWMEETTFTNAAAERAEGAAFAEAALALTERSQIVENVAVWLPVTDQQLEDISGIRDYIDGRLELFLRLRMNKQVISGNGTTPNLKGILNVAGIQTQAKGADPTLDALLKGMTKVRVTGQSTVSHVVLHPNDYQELVLTRTADGLYILGNPGQSPVDRVWGVPIVQTSELTEGTGLIGDFPAMCGLYYKRGIDLQITNAHSDYFINGKQAIRADLRAVMVVYRPVGFCTVTGI